MKRWVLIMVVVLLAGCHGNTDSVLLKPVSLAKVYPGEITDVNRIELLDGTSGARKMVEDQVIIKQWIRTVKDIPLIPDDNQEGAVGFRFRISLYEGEILKLGFSPHRIEFISYKSSDELLRHIEDLFETQYGKPF